MDEHDYNDEHEHDEERESLEDILRAIAREVTMSVEARMSEIDVDEIAESIGVDPSSARHWLDSAAHWLQAQAEHWTFGWPPHPPTPAEPMRSKERSSEDPLRDAGPHPLDLPTDEQGRALAALESGRWTIEPGTESLSSRGEGRGPDNALGLVRELRVRDWITPDGNVTLAGRGALGRWLEAAKTR
jgi:hypothetical protein